MFVEMGVEMDVEVGVEIVAAMSAYDWRRRSQRCS
jgi:hypothetical protein